MADLYLSCGRLLVGDARVRLTDLPDEHANVAVTSPPYWRLRDYGAGAVEWPSVRFAPVGGLPELEVPAQACALGAEDDPWAYVGHLVLVMRELRRVLRRDGVLWLNLGDTRLAGRNGGIGRSSLTSQKHQLASRAAWTNYGGETHVKAPGLKPKDLAGIPWRVAFALQADGWWLRSDVVWHKPNGCPESVRDRPSRAHEYLFLLSRSRRYHYDAAAIAEPVSTPPRFRNGRWGPSTRNKRSVWSLLTARYRGDHAAVFPEALVEPCLRAGCPRGGRAIDPFAGTGTVGVVAKRLGLGFVGIEISEATAREATARIEAG